MFTIYSFDAIQIDDGGYTRITRQLTITTVRLLFHKQKLSCLYIKYFHVSNCEEFINHKFR